jgi:uncharacterized protein
MAGKHATPWHKSIADAGTILRTEIGSGVHGTSVSGYDDRDEMGICIEPPVVLLGLKNFEQYEYHTAWERPGGLRERSRHGDLDETVYSLRKWLRLALNGNPSVMMPMFAPEDKIVKIDAFGMYLRSPEIQERIVSKVSGKRFAGYLHAQRRSMLSHEHPGKGRDVTRPELIEAYGFDTKFAGHMLRLGYQGVELMRTGSIRLPMWPDQREVVMAIRRGEYAMDTCLSMAEDLEYELNQLIKPGSSSPLPEEPDYQWADQWLTYVYQQAWEEWKWRG